MVLNPSYSLIIVTPCGCASVYSAYTSSVQSEILEKSLVREMRAGGGGGGRGSVSAMDSLHHSRSHPMSASAIEQLQSLLKQKEGELANAQVNNMQYVFEQNHRQVAKFNVSLYQNVQ